MQTIAVFTAPTSGIISINGRFAGETGTESPLIMPVTPNGTLYVEFSPFSRRFRPMAYKFQTSSGEFDMENTSDACYMMLWPDGICEFSLTPPAAYPPESEYSMLDDRPIALLRGEASLLRVGREALALPAGAQLPDTKIHINSAEIYMGKCPEGQYAAAFSAHTLQPISAITAGKIVHENNTLRATTDLNDTAGHTLIEIYTPTENALNLTSNEYIWTNNTPIRPESPEKTALTAIEAAMLNLYDEANSYLAPSLSQSNIISEISQKYDTVLPMKYIISKQPCLALVKKKTDRAATVTPLAYHAIPTDNAWQLDHLEITPFHMHKSM